ncbi:hypothetical protein [Plantactinospora sp. KLBMP9567]|uniref:hypothetical protein n=1 Tax=Plantactinospora sp. KLBMP9567 TaxID=3085900 RepID=UPI0029829D09|nr:hypothetical protein [Plantactinospora sp. KLBMP9567]MDW5329556.1 hypothetical protein [Plantactinospora sp. KLBMP9567]
MRRDTIDELPHLPRAMAMADSADGSCGVVGVAGDGDLVRPQVRGGSSRVVTGFRRSIVELPCDVGEEQVFA